MAARRIPSESLSALRKADVFVKGSERINSWEKVEDGVWKVELPNTFFGDYNPYELRVSEKYMTYGEWHHRGDLHINGKSLYEHRSLTDVFKAGNRWHCRVESGTTTIWAKFPGEDPNEELTEINVRESVFMPEEAGIDYITVDGFKFSHAASNWAPPSVALQSGSVGPRMGKAWVIENCEISDVRTVGIILGQSPGADYRNIDSIGGHIVRNNIIRRCGQAGIAGKRGATRSLIQGNLIEEINARREFGGHETAGIKFHRSVDTTIEGNLIRNVYREEGEAAFGMWIDFANQGMRITRNIVYGCETATLFLEMNHGPTLVDNNVFIGQPGISSKSTATIYAHNLFIDTGFRYKADVERSASYFKPHTVIESNREMVTFAEDQWLNNIFLRGGLSEVDPAEGFISDYNLFLEDASTSPFEGENSRQEEDLYDFRLDGHRSGVSLSFDIPQSALEMGASQVDANRIGILTKTKQKLEDLDGTPIEVTEDIRGTRFTNFPPGPLANLKAGTNVIEWPLTSDINLQRE